MQIKKSDLFFPFSQALQSSSAMPDSIPIPPSLPSHSADFMVSSFLQLEGENETRSKLINDMSLITIGDFSLLAMVAGNVIYLLENSKKDENGTIARFRDNIVVDINEKQTGNNSIPSSTFPLAAEVLLCCDFGFGSRFSGPSSGQLDLILACGGKSGIITLISIEEEYPINYLIGHINEINILRFAPPNSKFGFLNILASGSKDGAIIIWNIINQSKVPIFIPIFFFLFK
jgi:WD40 repeat protein